MARSVSTPGDAVYVAYQAFECETMTSASDDFMMRHRQPSLCAEGRLCPPGMTPTGGPVKTETIAENDFAAASEYCGLVAIWWCLPQDGAPLPQPLALVDPAEVPLRWPVAGVNLRTGVASQRQVFFQPMDGRQRGDGPASTSKEQWL